jgi:ligand-binding sensor domain-containing protein/signal transduction histidine kinase
MWNKKLELTSCIPRTVRRHYLLWGVIAAFCFENTCASEYLVNSWSAEDGLPQNTVTCITQTRDGYLWLGTLNGVARFDGIRFVVFGAHNTAELKSNRMLALLEDREGGLWIGTEGGGVTRLHLGRFLTLTTWEGLPSNIVQGLQEDASGRIWIRTQAGMCVWRRGAFLPVVASEAPLEEALRDVALPTASVGVVKRLSDGQVWAGTQEGGLLCLRNGHWANIPSPSEAGRHPVRCLFEDREKNLWVGTDGGGLVQLKPRRLLTLDARAGLPNEFILSMAEDGAGGLWLSASGGGISHWRQGSPPLPWPEAGPLRRNASIGPLLRARDGSLWVGTSGEGLFRWKNGETQLFGPSQGLPNPVILSLLEDRDGRIWIGTYADGLFLYQDGRFVNFGVKEGFPARNITAIVQDRDGDIWIGSNGMGLYRYADGRFSYYCRREGWGSDFIRTLLVDKEGALWIGSGGSGLTRMKDGWFHTVTTRQGLDDDVISQILEDDFGYLWIGSNRGIFRLSKQLFESFAAGRRTSVEGIAYGKSEGMQSLECTGGYQPAGLKARDGSLWFSTVKGAVQIEPARLVGPGTGVAVASGRQFNVHPPPVVIEEVWVNDEQVLLETSANAAATVVVRPGQKRMEIRYTGLCLTAPEKVRFRHRLVGLDPSWVEAGDGRVARYTQLPPGEYRFEVIACNNDGVWNLQGASVPLRIEPHLWQAAWFDILIGLLAVVGIAGAVRTVAVRRMRHKLEILRQRHALEEERSRIAQDLHDDMGAGLTEVALLSEVVRLNRDTPDAVEKNARRIFASSREMTQALDEIVWSVNPANDTLEKLVAFVCEFSQAFLGSAAIPCEVDVPAVVPDLEVNARSRHQICMMVKECLANVIKHACAKTVTLTLRLEGCSLEITVEDDGVGFDPARVKDTTGTHDGLVNLKQRLTVMNGTCEIQSVRGHGTRVRLMVGL